VLYQVIQHILKQLNHIKGVSKMKIPFNPDGPQSPNNLKLQTLVDLLDRYQCELNDHTADGDYSDAIRDCQEMIDLLQQMDETR
jgi:hypothetical protein